MRRLLLAVLVVALGLIAAPAFAERSVIKDARHDVWEEGGGAMPVMVPSKRVTNVDVTGMTVRHRTRVVTITVRYVELTRRHLNKIVVYGDLITDAGTEVFPTVVSEPGHPKGRHFLFGQALSSAPVRCPRMEHRIDYRRNYIRMTIPRRCLGRPAWVQVRATAVLTTVVMPWADAIGDRTSGDGVWTRQLHRG